MLRELPDIGFEALFGSIRVAPVYCITTSLIITDGGSIRPILRRAYRIPVSFIGRTTMRVVGERDSDTRLIIDRLGSQQYENMQMIKVDGRLYPHLVIAAAGLSVFAIGSLVSQFGKRETAAGVSSPIAADPHAGQDGAVSLSLAHYVQKAEADKAAAVTRGGQPLPDVNTMIDRLAARLRTEPGDANGWRMLGWSYFHTERYEEAASAYAKALELDPQSADLKNSYSTAKAKAAERSKVRETAN